MEFEVKESVCLEDGKYVGTVSKVEYRDEPYKYTDVYIKEAKTVMELKYGCPSVVSEKSKLGILIGRFIKLEKGTKVDPEKVLIGKKVAFMTMQEQTKDGTFTRIVDGSVKPLPVAQPKQGFDGVKTEG